MKVESKIQEIKSILENYKKKSFTIGFVPTMGALHKGHLSLIKQSKSENDITVVSIFVNPTQFNNKEDLEKYPRDLESDLSQLSKINTDLVFTPDFQEMYPGKENHFFDLNGLDSVMEGKHRQGHFNGVVQIVSKFFDIIQPNKAYFGKKDFQQLAIVKYMNEKYLPHLNVEIIGCEIIREMDGLAMSSRNLRLSPEHRKAAPMIFKTLKKYSTEYDKYSVSELMAKIASEINNNIFLEVEYIDIVDNQSLKTVDKIIPGRTTACIAAYAGEIRLIDNIAF